MKGSQRASRSKSDGFSNTRSPGSAAVRRVTGRPNQSDSAWSSLAVVPSGRVIVTLPSSRCTAAANSSCRYPPAGQPEAGPGVEESERAVAAQPLRLYLGRIKRSPCMDLTGKRQISWTLTAPPYGDREAQRWRLGKAQAGGGCLTFV